VVKGEKARQELKAKLNVVFSLGESKWKCEENELKDVTVM
jgi:hypothetical protein